MKKAQIIFMFFINCGVLFSGESNQEFQKLVDASNVIHTTYGKLVAHLPNKIGVIAGDDTAKQKLIVEQGKNVRLVMDDKVKTLALHFLECKKRCGNEIEKIVYQDMKLEAFFCRLLTQRPIMFMTSWVVSYLKGDGDAVVRNSTFKEIGTDTEQEPLVLANYISYDEMAISALIGVSVPTFFINNGRRSNAGAVDKEGTYEQTGVYTGLIGARFEKENLMEWQHMLVTEDQNTQKNGYGPDGDNELLKIWQDFYNVGFQTYQQACEDRTGRNAWIKSKKGYLDTLVYMKRMEMSILPYLIDANARAQQQNKSAYCHIVGLGLGEWAIDEFVQAKCILHVFKFLIEHNTFTNIADINFSWFPKSCQRYKNIFNGNKAGGIKIHFSRRDPADKLIGSDSGKLLVPMYAWDGNSWPGNEYWRVMLTASGDPAAACCSTISELQNPDVNHYLI